ncbi:tyrosine-type recombinase/integrase [Micropruina sp.]|uniref:tyrosine-type recombinase/integrase n=1 Tax=Micropruina sp. TaxID=2737536 RepID=UPI0039E390BE
MGHIRDRWMQPGPNGRKVRSDRWGKGLRWQVRWETPTGQRSKSFPNKDAAASFLAEQQLGLLRRPASTETFAELAKRWQASQLHHRPGTKATVSSTLNVLILPTLGGLTVADIERQQLQDVVNGWVNAGYSAARARVAWSHISSMLTMAVDDGILEKPVKGVRLPALSAEKVVPLTVAQVEHIVSRVPKRYRAMVIVDAGSGLRSGELRGLTEDRVGDVLQVDRQLVGSNGRRPMFGPPKSDASVRRVPIGPTVVAAIEQHLKEFGPGPGGLVFSTRYRSPVSRSTAGDVWRQGSAGLDLPPRNGWHMLRHFHASLLIAAGLSVTLVAERLGHADPAETLGTYAHLWPTDQERATATIEATFGASAILTGTAQGPGEGITPSES